MTKNGSFAETSSVFFDNFRQITLVRRVKPVVKGRQSFDAKYYDAYKNDKNAE